MEGDESDMKESPEEYLIRQMREMQKHHLDVMADISKRSHSVDDALYLQYHKNQYNLLTELIDMYDDACAEQNQPKEGLLQ